MPRLDFHGEDLQESRTIHVADIQPAGKTGVEVPTMRGVKFAIYVMVLSFAVVNVQAEGAHASLPRSELPQFLARYEQSLKPIDAAFGDLSDQPFPMRDDSGRRVGRREIRNRRKLVANVRTTARALAARPDDLVLALTLFDLTEKLGDDLYDLSQIAYDNDLEEPAARLTELLATVNYNQDLIEGYVFNLATDKQKQLQQLRGQKQEER